MNSSAEEIMRALKITKCTDPQMWYAKYIGFVVPLIDEDPDEFITREVSSGYINIVRKTDCEIVDATVHEILMRNYQVRDTNANV